MFVRCLDRPPDEDVVEIKPAKMVLNLWVPEKEFNEKVKLVTVSDGEVEEIASLNFLDHEHLDQEVAENVDDISR